MCVCRGLTLVCVYRVSTLCVSMSVKCVYVCVYNDVLCAYTVVVCVKTKEGVV